MKSFPCSLAMLFMIAFSANDLWCQEAVHLTAAWGIHPHSPLTFLTQLSLSQTAMQLQL